MGGGGGGGNVLNFYSTPISLSNIIGKIYETNFLQDALVILNKSKLFDRKMSMHKKKKNLKKKTPQALLPLIEQMSEAITSNKMRFMLRLT